MRTAVAAIAILALAVAAPAADAKPAKPCSRKGSTTVKATKSVRVYRVNNNQGGQSLIGCLRSDDKRQVLARGYDDGYVLSGDFAHVKVAGRFVAWEFTDTDISCKAACPPGYNPDVVRLHIRDLRERKTEHVDGNVASKGRLVLTKGGSIAWTQQGANDVEVDAFDSAGRRQLDHGQIPPGSLRLEGKVASWTNAGAPRSATLTPRP
jgi:hypothetical protein